MKFAVDSDIAVAFKARCAGEGISMASAVQRFMATTCRPAKVAERGTRTRPLRRKTVAAVIGVLTDVMDSEAEYGDRIPEVFEQRRDAAEHACERLEEAISCLEDAF
jgi:hypothetical protein